MNFYNFLLLIIIIINKIYYEKSYAKKLHQQINQKYKFIYKNLLYDDFCHISNEILYCGSKNDKNITLPEFENQNIGNVRLSLNFSNYLRKDELMVGRETMIKYLWLMKNNITFVEKNVFDSFTSLKTLNFYYTNLTTINENILTKRLGSHLKGLFLSYNNILFLTSSTFQFMSNLIELSLEGNQNVGNFINNGILIKSLMNLEWLFLGKCNITVLNENIFNNLTNLQYLQLSNNPLTTIPKAINFIPKLFLLTFDNSSIATIQFDKNVFNKKLKIITLRASKNLLNINNCGFCNFPNLWSIDLSDSSLLSNIHKNAFGSNIDMPKLEEIKMEHCNISSLPKMIFMRKIKIFLQNNPINIKGIFSVNVL